MEKEYIIKEFEDLLNLLRERLDYLEKLRMLILTKDLRNQIENLKHLEVK